MPHLPYPLSLTHHQQAAAVVAGVFVLGGAVWLALRRPRPSAEAVEQARRERLALTGRITDGSLVDTTTIDGSFLGDAARDDAGQTGAPKLLLFRYSIAGVRYEAVQDVSALPDAVRDLRIDLPIQVRYDHQNPADSIVVAEQWCGLRFRGSSGVSIGREE